VKSEFIGPFFTKAEICTFTKYSILKIEHLGIQSTISENYGLNLGLKYIL